MEADLQKSLMRADTALKFAEQVWWSWNLSRNRLKIYSAGECILGYGHEDLEHHEQFWWDRMHPEDRDEVEESLQDCFAGSAEVWRCEHRLKDVSGDWVWVEQSGFVIRRKNDGGPLEMAGTTRKVQERYQLLDLFRGSESVIDAMAQKAPISFWLRDPEGIVLMVSQHLKGQFGEPENKPQDASLCMPGELDSWREAFHEALQGNPLKRQINLLGQTGEARAYAHHLIAVPLDRTPFGVLELFIPEPA